MSTRDDSPVPRPVNGDRSTVKMRLASGEEAPREHAEEDAPPRRKPPSREDSHSMARAAVEAVDDYSRRRAGVGISPDTKEFLTNTLNAQFDSLRDQFEEFIDQMRERRPKTGRHETLQHVTPVREHVGLAVAVVTAVGLVITIIIGSMAMWRLGVRLDSRIAAQDSRIAALDVAQREHAVAVGARLTEAENTQIKLRAEIDQRKEDTDKIDSDHERRLMTLEVRQMALVVYLLDSVNKLLKDRGIPVPDVPPELRIAEAEAEGLFTKRSPR